MSYFVSHLYGGHDREPGFETFPALLEELDAHPDEIEHVSVSVVHESEWSVAAHVGNDLVVLENLEDLDASPRHMRGVPREEVLRLFELVAAGRLDDVFAMPWLEGYG